MRFPCSLAKMVDWVGWLNGAVQVARYLHALR
jgi:hypothetical protein